METKDFGAEHSVPCSTEGLCYLSSVSAWFAFYPVVSSTQENKGMNGEAGLSVCSRYPGVPTPRG